MLAHFQNELNRLKEKGLYRTLKKVTSPVDTTVTINGREVILFSSNNYLGLANHPALKKAAISVLQNYGSGAGASRLISGNLEIHEELEQRIAAFKKCSAAIIFSTGYMANIGAITSLAGKNALILSDQLNHASIIDGCRLSTAETKIYPHKDLAALEKILRQALSHHDKGGYNNIFLITDGIFSMDGDITPLPDLLKIADRYNAIVILDDAHATGVIGKNGGGTPEYFNIADNERLIQIGTFSKSLGSLGGYVAGSELIIEFLRNRARSFIYSTALPPSVSASSIAAINILEQDKALLQSLQHNIDRFKKGITEIGYGSVEIETPIIPIIIGDADLTMEFADALLKKGVYAPGIRPPTVSENQSRIRVSLMSSHTEDQIDTALSVFEEEGKRLGII
ncbi:MAG: 8-amino-7-oxononanoate synthase [Deltaproteobacteria bacterium]|nr:8-amino-7-oxononanoate synthase [Deltaproteobacteria bacterium]